MALIHCRDCGRQVSDRAPTCPGCGGPIAATNDMPAAAPKKRSKMKIGCGALIVLLAIPVVGFFIHSALMSPERRETIAGCIMAQRFATTRLRAPSTAQFPTCGGKTMNVVKTGPNTWIAKGYVDAQNSFGAKIRSTYVVTMRHTPGDKLWGLVDATIGTWGAPSSAPKPRPAAVMNSSDI
jgi:hypothetical protein